MSLYPVHTLASAPEASADSLRALEAAFGFVPNVAGAMAASPVLIGSLVALFGRVHGGNFTEREIQVLLLTNAVANGAGWAVAFHSHLALEQGIEPADVEALRAGRFPREPRLAALSGAARGLIEARGKLAPAAVGRFLDAGFAADRLLEVVAVVAASAITNYTANLAEPPLEPVFAAQSWPAPAPSPGL